MANPNAGASPARRRARAPQVLPRIERRVLHALAGLPPSATRRLVRGRFSFDDDMLDPGIALILAVRKLRGFTSLTLGTPEATRALMRRETKLAVRRPTPVRAVRDLTVDGETGPLPARLYDPDGRDGPHPLLVFFHGGGFVAGDLDGHDEPCRVLCRYAGVHVLSVSYRLAPEHPFPASAEDAYAALQWAHKNAADLGVDPARVAVGGDSAGGNLAAVASLLAVRRGGVPPAAQLLIYPPTDYHNDWPSRSAFADGLLLTEADIDWFHSLYSATAPDPSDPRLSPLFADDLSGLPPAMLVTAAFDPLRDEGEAYAEALRSAGNQVVAWRAPAMVHGFLNMTTLSRAARDAVLEIAGALRVLLSPVVTRSMAGSDPDASCR